MDTRDAIRAALAASGTSIRGASLAAGRSANALSSTLNVNRGDIGAGLAAAYARPCGYVLALIPAGDVPAGGIVIDPAAPDAQRVENTRAAQAAKRERENTWGTVMARQKAVLAEAESRQSRES